jgi:hypothetical protein
MPTFGSYKRGKKLTSGASNNDEFDKLDKELYKIKEVAELFGVHENSIRDWIDKGRLESVGTGATGAIESKSLIPRESVVECARNIKTGGQWKAKKEISTNPQTTFFYPFVWWMVYQIIVHNKDFKESNKDLIRWGMPKPTDEEWEELREKIISRAPPKITFQYKTGGNRAFPKDGEFFEWLQSLTIDDVYYNPEVLKSDILSNFSVRMQVDLMLKSGVSYDEICEEVYERECVMLSEEEIMAYHKYFANFSHVDEERYQDYLDKVPHQVERGIKFNLANQDIEVLRFAMGFAPDIDASQDSYIATAAYMAMKHEINERGTRADPDKLAKLIKIRSDAIKNFTLLGGNVQNDEIEFLMSNGENEFIANDVEESIADMAGSQEILSQKEDQVGTSIGGKTHDEDPATDTGTDG